MSDDLHYPTQAHGAIPSFKSMEEEVEWWDETDTGEDEIEAEMTPLTVRSTSGYTKQLMVRLDDTTDSELEQLAKERGVKKSTLVRMFVMEQLRQEQEHRRAS